MERLQRVLAAAGIASRRRSEELILEGRIRVDGEIVTELGTKVDPSTQKIEVDGKLIPIVRRRYILLHKPSGYITTTSDERRLGGRPTVNAPKYGIDVRLRRKVDRHPADHVVFRQHRAPHHR